MEEVLKKLLDERKNIKDYDYDYLKCKNGHLIMPGEFVCRVCYFKYTANQCFGMHGNYQSPHK